MNIGIDHFAPVKEQLGMNRCAACGLIFTNPRPSERMLVAFYNKDGYDCHSDDFEPRVADSGAHARLMVIEGMATKDSLLDFGAGAGHLLRAARKRQWRRLGGIELGGIARQKLIREGFNVYESLGTWQASREKADVVTMVHVLEHLTDPTTTLHGIRDLALERNGILYIEVPNVDSLRARLALSPLRPLWTANAERYLAFPIHLLYFNSKSLKRFLQRLGFHILKLGTLGLGVEELRAGSGDLVGSDIGPGSQETDEPSRGNMRSAVPTFLKGSIKRVMSASLLGENLYAICKPSQKN